MDEQRVPASTVTDPQEWKNLMLAAASRGATAVDDAGVLHVLRYHDIEKLLHEPRLHGVGLSIFDAMGITDGPLRDWYGALMFTNDGPIHDRLRRLVSKTFTPRAVDRLRHVAASLVDERMTAVRAAGGGDLVAKLKDVPMRVMCALVGVPAAAVPDFIAWVDALSPVFGFMDASQIDAASAAITDLLSYVRGLVGRRSETPGDDLITSLLRAEHDGDHLTRDETVSMVANLLVGGHDTTASQIGCSLLTLLARPERLALARADAAAVPLLVAETIRLEPSIAAAPRTIAEPFVICGVERPAGTMVACNFLTANRDPDVWRDPGAFVPRRFEAPEAPRLLSFGGGPHFCLGASLARMTLEETVRRVAAASPALDQDPDDIAWVQVLGRSPARLSVTC